MGAQTVTDGTFPLKHRGLISNLDESNILFVDTREFLKVLMFIFEFELKAKNKTNHKLPKIVLKTFI